MTYWVNIALLLLLVLTAASATFLVKELMSSVFILGSYSFFLALVWAWLGAVDVAFVEAVIGAGLATVLFLITLFDTAPKDARIRRPPLPWPVYWVCRCWGSSFCSPPTTCLPWLIRVHRLMFIFLRSISSRVMQTP